jgi:flagellar motor component MotA
MFRIFQDASRTHLLANTLLIAGLVLLLLGMLGGYVLNGHLVLFVQVAAHLLVIIGPTLIKIGYVMRLNACERLHLSY